MRSPLGVPQYVIILAWLVVGPVIGLIAVMPLTELWRDAPWLDTPPDSVPAQPLVGPSAVLSPDSGATLFPLCSRPEPGLVLSTWRPDSLTVARLEHDLARVLPLLELPYERAAHALAWTQYYRQYIGISTLTNFRLIYINAFRDPERFPNWTVSPVRQCDGGDDLWGLEYDPATRRFRGFTDNGSA
jgi:hypothetical protein